MLFLGLEVRVFRLADYAEEFLSEVNHMRIGLQPSGWVILLIGTGKVLLVLFFVHAFEFDQFSFL